MRTHETITQVGPYLLDREVGRGNSAVVWRAYDEVSGELVAVKMLDESMKNDVDSRTRFARECELVGAFSHPGLIRLRAAGRTHDGVDYLVMDLAMGPTLRSCWAHRAVPVSPRDVVALLSAVSEAVGVMHQAGWVHRDLKPANIIMDPQGHPRLLDFGLTSRVGDDRMLTETGFFVGTPIYLAPEQPLGARPTTMMDVYALGGVLYEGLVGQPPFLGETDKIFQQKSSQDAPRYDGFAPLARLLASTLSRRPDSRPKDATVLADTLKDILETMPGEGDEPRPKTQVFMPSGDRSSRIVTRAETTEEARIDVTPEKQFFGEATDRFLQAICNEGDDRAWLDELLRGYQPELIHPFQGPSDGRAAGAIVAVVTAGMIWSLIAVVQICLR